MDELNPDVTEALNETEEALAAGFDPDSPEVNEKLAALRKKLGLVDDADKDPSVQQPGQPMGSDVDWSEYDLDPRFAHMYPKSRLDQLPEGPRWTVDVVEYLCIKDHYGTIGQKITQHVNGPGGWRLQSAIVPINSNTGCVTLQRIFPIILPTPNKLKVKEDVQVAPPTEEQLAAMEAQAQAWVNGEGTPPPPAATPAEAVTPIALEDRDEPTGEFQPTRENIIEGARTAAAEFVAASGDPDRPND